MTRPASCAERRAAALLRWYPRAWRDRYGEEFLDLLVAEIDERPRSLGRTADVARAGLAQRASSLGLADGPSVRPESALAATGGALAVVGLLAVSLWTQLTFGVHATPSASHTASLGVVVYPLTAVYVVLLAVAALVPLAVAAIGRLRRIAGPVTLAVAGLVVLIGGGEHFAAGRPGAGRAAAFGWAETVGISTYWVHPTRILSLSPGLVAWMALSLVAVVVIAGAAMTAVRRLDLSSAALRFERRVAEALMIGGLPALLVSAGWVLTSQASWDADLRAGSLDVFLLLVLVAAVAVAASSARRIGQFAPH